MDEIDRQIAEALVLIRPWTPTNLRRLLCATETRPPKRVGGGLLDPFAIRLLRVAA
nr:hypothetical protein [uncultured Sphingomonas sp.]